jgi:hypothetical protein
MWFVPEEGFGIIMLCSGDPFSGDRLPPYERMITALVEKARAYA